MASKGESAIRSADKLQDKYYHYTSVDAMVSIMNNRRLRFTRSEFLNDPADSRVLTKTVAEYLKDQENVARIMRENVLPEALDRVGAIYDRAPLIDYIRFLQKSIHLYVLSFTENKDHMPMWNNYGSGGMQIEVDRPALIRALRSSLNDSQYLTYSPVKYIPEGEAADRVDLVPFHQFHLDRGAAEENIFEKHSNDKAIYFRNLYQITKLKKYIDAYIREYFRSLDYLSDPSKCLHPISMENDPEPEDIFKRIHANACNCQHRLTFKKDLTLYMLVLSALIKSDTYEYEKEFRIVVFENTLTPTCDIQYGVQNLNGQKYLRPYWETQPLDMSFIKEIALSPLTRNLPMDDELYAETMTDFASRTLDNGNINVAWSAHKVRW